MKKLIRIHFFFIVCLGAVCLGAIWYFGHHRPAKKIMKAEPMKIFKATEPSTPEKSMIKLYPNKTITHERTPTDSLLEESTNNTSEISMDDPFKKSTDNVVEESTDTSADIQTDTSNTSGVLDPDTQWLIDESNRIVAEADSTRTRLAAKKARVAQLINQKMPQVINYLKSLPAGEQVAELKRTKHLMVNREGIWGVIFNDIPSETLERGWQHYLNRLEKHGYVIPPGID